MKHLLKRAFVLLMAASVVFTSVPVQNVYAEKGGITDQISEKSAHEEDVIRFENLDLITMKGEGFDICARQSVYIQNANYPTGEWMNARITDIQSDTATIYFDEEDDCFEFSYRNADADSGTVTVTYYIGDSDDLSELDGPYTYETTYAFKSATYYLDTKITGPAAWMVKGQTKTIKPVISRSVVVEEDGDFYYEYEQDIELIAPLTAEWIYDETFAANYVEITEHNDGSLSAKAINGTEEEIHIPLKLVIKEQGEIVATVEQSIDLTTSYDEIVVIDTATGKKFEAENLKLGESVTIRPAVMRYTYSDTNGEELNCEVTVTNAGGETVKISENEDGSYTITRVNNGWISIWLDGKYEDGSSINDNISLEWLDVTFDYSTSLDEFGADGIVLFTDDTLNVAASCNEISAGLVWEWDFVVYGEDDILYRDNVARGRDLKTFTLDGSKYKEWLKEAEDFAIELTLYVGETAAEPETIYIYYQEPQIPVQAEGVWEDLVSITGGMDITYEGYVKTKEYPEGEYGELENRNLKILSGNDVVSIKNEDNLYSITILKEGTALLSYDLYFENELIKEDITFEVQGVTSVNKGWIEESIGKDWILKNETLTLTPNYYLDCYSKDGYLFKEELDDLRLEVVDFEYWCWDDDCDSKCENEAFNPFVENEDGTLTFAPNNHATSIEIDLDVYAGSEKIDNAKRSLFAVEEQEAIWFDKEAELKALKAGESVTVKHEYRRFSIEEPEGTFVRKMPYPAWEYDSSAFEITDHEDGSYTVKRLTSGAAALSFAYLVFEDDPSDAWARWSYEFGCSHENTRQLGKKEATCFEAGYSTAVVCEDCNYLISKSNPVDKLSHEMTYYEAKEATCTEDGNVEYWYCSVCKKNYESETAESVLTTVVIEKLEHNLTQMAKVNATYETTGTKEHYKCVRETCGKLYWDEGASSEVEKAEDLVIAKLVYVALETKAETFETEVKVTVDEILKAIKEGTAENISGVSKETVGKLVEAVNAGYDIEIQTVIEAVAEEAVLEHLAKIEAAVSSEMGELEFKQLADISMILVKTLAGNSETIGKITELEKPVTLSFVDVETAPSGMKYVVIRLHKNADETVSVDVLEAKQAGTKVSFETDKFSVYALALVPDESTDWVGEFAGGEFSLSLEGELYVEYMPDLSNFNPKVLAEGKGGLAIWKGNGRPSSSRLVMPDAQNCDTLKNMHWSDTLHKWTFTTMGIPARQYGDTLYMRPFIELADGTYVTGGILVYSPEEFCKKKLNSDDTPVKLKALCASILEYGAAAQNYFDYKDKDDTVNGEDLVNYENGVKMNYSDYFENADSLLAYSVELLDELVPLPSGFGAQFESGSIKIPPAKDHAKATLTLEGAVVIDIINYDVPVADIDHALLQVWSEEDLLATKDFTYDSDSCTIKVEMGYGTLVDEEGYVATMKDENSKYVGVPAKECGDTVYFMTYFVAKDGTIYRNGMRKYSPDEYVRSKVEGSNPTDNEDLKDLCKGLAVYSEKARTYFNYKPRNNG